jgi:soluble lytic murein transglycosylase-like protein
MVEGGRPGLSAANRDGSADLGVMQINSLWVAALARYLHQPEGATRQRLLDEPCFNIAAAGAIMRIYLNDERGDLRRAIGDYHSHQPARNQSYQLKVFEAVDQLSRRFPAPF